MNLRISLQIQPHFNGTTLARYEFGNRYITVKTEVILWQTKVARGWLQLRAPVN
jgi:hypothetical protein